MALFFAREEEQVMHRKLKWPSWKLKSSNIEKRPTASPAPSLPNSSADWRLSWLQSTSLTGECASFDEAAETTCSLRFNKCLPKAPYGSIPPGASLPVKGVVGHGRGETHWKLVWHTPFGRGAPHWRTKLCGTAGAGAHGTWWGHGALYPGPVGFSTTAPTASASSMASWATQILGTVFSEIWVSEKYGAQPFTKHWEKLRTRLKPHQPLAAGKEMDLNFLVTRPWYWRSQHGSRQIVSKIAIKVQ